jgi:16S rRNA (cytosine967-C5)-methyltransferase
VRLDSSRITPEAALQQLQHDQLQVAPGAMTGGALLVTGGDVTQHPLYQSGDLWIQDEGSQLVALLLEPQSSDLLLDACAAPGGKTAVLQTRAPQARILAMDRHPHRARLLARLHEGRHSWVIAADASQPLPVRAAFDRILVDAPCSGTGTLARNPEIRWRLQPDDLPRLQRLQLSILSNVVNWLRPGGRLVYSVCSLEEEEGPAVVRRFLRHHREFRQIPAATVLERMRATGDWTGSDQPTLLDQDDFRTLPGVHPCDGFFAAVLEKAE